MKPHEIEYWGRAKHAPNLQAFREWAEANQLELFYSNKEKSPWQLFANVGPLLKYPQLVVFYPHLLKAVWQGFTAVGIAHMDDLMRDVTKEAMGDDE